jgi:hypothetical protein
MAPRFVLAIALSACSTTQQPVRLAALSRTTMALTTVNDPLVPAADQYPAIGISLLTPVSGPDGNPADCPTISNDVTATFDGLTAQLLTAGGWEQEEDGLGCNGIEFALQSAPPLASSELVVADGTTTWTLDGVDLLTDDIALVPDPPTGHVQLVWPSAAAIVSAFIQISDSSGHALLYGSSNDDGQVQFAVTLVGNTMDFVLPAPVTGTLSVYAYRTPSASRCEGPAACELQVTVAQRFTARSWPMR